MEIDSSDHKPIFSSFDVGITSQFARKPITAESATTETSAKIIFREINAQVGCIFSPPRPVLMHH